MYLKFSPYSKILLTLQPIGFQVYILCHTSSTEMMELKSTKK